MTSPITGPTGTATNTTPTPGTPKAKNTLDEDSFLKLLVAQMKYQDPSKPMDTTQMMAQTATYSQIQTLNQLLGSQQMQAASALVGRTVTYQDADGNTFSGVVTKTKLNGDSEPTLVVGNTDVQLSKVTEVQETQTPTTKES